MLVDAILNSSSGIMIFEVRASVPDDDFPLECALANIVVSNDCVLYALIAHLPGSTRYFTRELVDLHARRKVGPPSRYVFGVFRPNGFCSRILEIVYEHSLLLDLPVQEVVVLIVNIGRAVRENHLSARCKRDHKRAEGKFGTLIGNIINTKNNWYIKSSRCAETTLGVEVTQTTAGCGSLR